MPRVELDLENTAQMLDDFKQAVGATRLVEHRFDKTGWHIDVPATKDEMLKLVVRLQIQEVIDEDEEDS